MLDLNPIYNNVDHSKSPRIENLSDKNRSTFAKTFYVLAHQGFQNLDFDLKLAKKCLIFGQDVLCKELTAKLWFFIGIYERKLINVSLNF